MWFAVEIRLYCSHSRASVRTCKRFCVEAPQLLYGSIAALGNRVEVLVLICSASRRSCPMTAGTSGRGASLICSPWKRQRKVFYLDEISSRLPSEEKLI